jgi:hypothetical protein
MVYRHKTQKNKQGTQTTRSHGGTQTTTLVQPPSTLPPLGLAPGHYIISVSNEVPVPNEALTPDLDNEFEQIVAIAPTLNKIQSYTSQYNYDYLKITLRKIADGDLHRQYTSPLKISTEYVFVLSQIIDLIQSEIDTIQTTYASGIHVFSPTDRDFILNELTKYMEYFQRYGNKQTDRVNLDYHEALFH